MLHPKVFRVSYETDIHHRVITCGGMDSEYSHTTRERKVEYIVASEIDFAVFLWENRNKHNKDHSEVEWEELGNVTILITDRPIIGI
jgi:hypothetical protein